MVHSMFSHNFGGLTFIIHLGGLGSDINFSKFVEEEVTSSREARCLIQGHLFGKCWVRVSNLRINTLNSVQFPTIQIHTKMGYWENRSKYRKQNYSSGEMLTS